MINDYRKALKELPDILLEASEIIASIQPQNAPRNYRQPIIDELRGYAFMIETEEADRLHSSAGFESRPLIYGDAAPVPNAAPVADSIAVDDLLKLLPNDSSYLDEPDGGSPTVLEQLQRMAQDAAQCRELRSQLEAAEKDALFVTIGLVQAAGGKVTVTAVDAMQIKNLTLHRQVQTMGIEFWTEPTK